MPELTRRLQVFREQARSYRKAGNKKPDNIIGLGVARQAGKSVFSASDVHPGALRLSLA